jgi:hypothetical protein
MSDETESLASELETPATPMPAPADNFEDNPELGTLDDEGNELLETQPDDDLEEFEWEGKQIKVPKGLKDGVLRQADYTRKTQEVAAKAKELDEMRERINQQSKASEEELDARAQLRHVNSELERFKDWGWAQVQQLSQTDPVKADEIWKYKQHLASEKSGLEQTLSTAQQKRTQEAQQSVAKRLEQTRDHARKLPGYKEGETESQVIEFAKSKGFSEGELRAAMSPKVFEMFHLARLGELAIKKPAAKPAAPSQPLETVGAKSNPPARRNLADMSMDEYAAYRNKQLKR